ncbi:IS1 family transposase [Enterobacter roggenkampii]
MKDEQWGYVGAKSRQRWRS